MATQRQYLIVHARGEPRGPNIRPQKVLSRRTLVPEVDDGVQFRGLFHYPNDQHESRVIEGRRRAVVQVKKTKKGVLGVK